MATASAAFNAFFSADHGECATTLEQITSARGHLDAKVAHNSYLNEYYKSGCADPRQLLLQLTQAYDRARAGDKKDTGKKKKDEEEEDTNRQHEDLTVLRYNQALLCVQLRQYTTATMILEELFDNIEPTDDFLAIKICFLRLEAAILQRDPEQALPILAYLEKPHAFPTLQRNERPARGDSSLGDQAGADADDGGGEVAEASVVMLAKSVPSEVEEKYDGPLPSLTLGGFLPRHGRAPEAISLGEYRFYCLMYRARVFAQLKNTRGSKKDVKAANEALEQDLKPGTLLKAHPHTTGTSDTAQVALQEALFNHQSAMLSTMKAYIEYTKGNVPKAARLLQQCQFNFAQGGSDFHPTKDDTCAALFYNNLGCVHFMMQKPSLATLYFQKALDAADALTSDGVHPVLGHKVGLTRPGVVATRHWLDRRAETCYNAGLQMLMSGRPTQAFNCFQQCTSVFRTWPRLWMRLAECCLEMHRQVSASVTSIAGGDDGLGTAAKPGLENCGGGQQLTWAIQGAASYRRWLLPTSKTPQVGQYSADDIGSAPMKGSAPASRHPSDVGDDVSSALSAERALCHAVMYLRNVLVLTASSLPQRPSGDASGGADSDGDGAAEGRANGATVNGKETSVAAKEGADKAAKGAVAKAAAAAKASDQASTRAKAAAAPSAPTPPISGAAAYRPVVREMIECEASLLEDSALLKLAYVALCQNNVSSALRYSRKLLEKNGLVASAAVDGSGGNNEGVEDWTFLQGRTSSSGVQATGVAAGAKYPASVGCTMLGVLYASEALLLSGKVADAKALLGSYVQADAAPKGAAQQNNAFQEAERLLSVRVVGGMTVTPPSEEGQERAKTACGGLSPSTLMGGMTSSSSLLGNIPMRQLAKDCEKDNEKGTKDKEGSQIALVCYPPAEFPRLGEAQCTLLTNLASIHVQDGNFNEAERCCEKALHAHPSAIPPLRTLAYLLLRKGEHAQAIERLRQSRQRAPSGA